jgi:predicted nucleotidyltransferase
MEAAIRDRRDVAAVYLFGGVAAETATADSDVDLGVLYEAPPRSTLDAGPLDLEGELEQRVGRPVHLVVLNTAPADLRIRVLRAERLLIDRNPSARIRFEVATRNEYFDLEPMLQAYRASPPSTVMTAPALVAKKLASIETALAELETGASGRHRHRSRSAALRRTHATARDPGRPRRRLSHRLRRTTGGTANQPRAVRVPGASGVDRRHVGGTAGPHGGFSQRAGPRLR